MFTKGSEWRIWDLQIQTILDDRYVSLSTYSEKIKEELPEEWKVFCDSIGGEENALLYDSREYFFNTQIDKKERCVNYVRTTFNFLETFLPDLGLVGITDHNYYDDLLLDVVIDYQNKSRCKAICGVEINVGGVHILVYFDKPIYGKRSFSDGIKTFLSKINVDAPKRNNVLVVSNKSIFDVINEIESEGGIYIFPHCNSDNGLFQERGKTDRTHLSDIFNFRQIVLLQSRSFANCQKTQGYIKSNPELFKSKSIHTIASDARSLIDFGGKDEHGNYLWVKADPTFEGLKQIQYEPEERLKIQASNPFLDHEKPFLSKITISQKTQIFENDTDIHFSENQVGIPLNQNLVTIIGGRGEGKSMLTDYIATSFLGHKPTKVDKYSKPGFLNVEYSKTNHNLAESLNFPINDLKHSVEFIYINQGKLKEEVQSKEKQKNLAESIRKLAKLNAPKFDENLEVSSNTKINRIHELTEWFEESDTENNLLKINTVDYLDGLEKSITELISNITTQETKDRLERYTQNTAKLNTLNTKIRELLNLKNTLTSTLSDLNTKIEEFDGVPELNQDIFKSQMEAIDEQFNKSNVELVAVNNDINSVKNDFKEYKGDINTLLNDVEKFQKNLFDTRKRKSEALSNAKELESLKKELFEGNDQESSLIHKIKGDYDRQQSQLLTEWGTFRAIDNRDDLNDAQKEIMRSLLHDLDVEVMIDFDVDKFYDELSHCIDGSKWRKKYNRSAQEEAFEITNFNSYFKFLETKYLDTYYWDGVHSDAFKNLLFNNDKRKSYISVLPILKYQKRNLNKISVGQKGTVYLKMMLATEAFSKPIIFDQPEDDLDNEFIMNNLIDLFKELKRYRQVIIVTHNANLVVNADAEQVIIAKNEKGVLNYVSGSLEDQNINNSICQILEGGERAFENRRNKYQFSK